MNPAINPSQSTSQSSASSSILRTELSLIQAAGGFAAPIQLEAELATVITAVLANPIALHNLSDRVFELLCQDLRRQQERHPL